MTHIILGISDGSRVKSKKLLATGYFVISIILWFLELRKDDPDWFLTVVFGFFALIWFLKSGCGELVEKGYLERNSIGIGLPIAEEPSHTTVHTDRVYGGSAVMDGDSPKSD